VWPTAVLALLVGLAGGVVTAAVAGARRADTAMDRFVTFDRPDDLSVQRLDAATGDQVAALPQVADADRYAFIFVAATPDGSDSGAIVALAAADDHAFVTMNRVLVVAGHRTSVDRPFDVMVTEVAASRRHWRVGSRFTLYAYSRDQIEQSSTSGGDATSPPAGPTFTLRVAGIVRAPSDVSPVLINQDVSYEGQQIVLLTPAFLRTYSAALGLAPDKLPGEGLHIRLNRGVADLDAFTAAARPLIGSQAQVQVGSDTARGVDSAKRAIHFQALALLAFAVLAAATSVLVVGQALSRQVALDAGDHPTMRALGMTGGQLRAAAVGRSILVGAAGAALAVVLAAALSPLFPTGLARQAEVDPGFSLDVAVLVAGAAATFALVLLRGSVAAYRATGGRGTGPGPTPVARPSRLADTARRMGFSATAVAGTRMSLEPGLGRTTVPVRTAMVGAAGAVAGVVAALTFVASLHGLVHNPRQQGWNWDVLVGNPNSQGGAGPEIESLLRANPEVGAFAALTPLENVRIAGHSMAAMTVDSLEGDVSPTVVEGRVPRGADELALGGVSLAAIGHAVGDTVTILAGDRTATMRIVGRVVVPTVETIYESRLGTGAVLASDGARRLFADVPPANVMAVRYRAGADPHAAFASLQRDFPRLVLRQVPAGEVENLRRVGDLPIALAALLVALGGAAMAHALVTSIRRRRRDLAILKTVGFVRRQVTAAVAWQASTLAVVALVVGLPVGLAVGRRAWALVVDQIGIRAVAIVPLTAVLAVVPVTVVVANLVAFVPGLRAARLRPATVLRSE